MSESSLRLRDFAGHSWPPIPAGVGKQVWAAYLQIQKMQWQDAQEIERGQLAQVRTLLAHCKEHVPYYRAMMRDSGIDPQDVQSISDFRKLPLLSKKTYVERFQEFQAIQLPAGTVREKSVHTSGSTATPTEVAQTNVVRFWWHVLYLRSLEWGKIDPAGRLALIRAWGMSGAEMDAFLAGVQHPYWTPIVHSLIETGPAFYMDVRQDTVSQLRWLREVRPNYLDTYATNLDALASLIEESGEKLPDLRAVRNVGETVTDDAKLRIERGFGARLIDMYNATEAGFVAGACPEGHGMHVHAENVLLEVLDEAGNDCKPGETGRVVLTTLHNFQAPLIRYEIMDEASVGPERCPCGRGLPLLSRVFGRLRALIHLPDGRVKNGTALCVALRHAGGHYQHQVVQKSLDSVLVRVVPDGSWTDDHVDRIRRAVELFFEAPVRVEVRIESNLRLAGGGKFQSVVSELSL